MNFLIREKYYKDRILLFGNALHVIHPLVGQGFNMVLRDLKSLNNELDKRINLGLDIGSSDILIEFTNSNKPGNFVFAVGTDVLRNCFNFKNIHPFSVFMTSKIQSLYYLPRHCILHRGLEAG